MKFRMCFESSCFFVDYELYGHLLTFLVTSLNIQGLSRLARVNFTIPLMGWRVPSGFLVAFPGTVIATACFSSSRRIGLIGIGFVGYVPRVTSVLIRYICTVLLTRKGYVGTCQTTRLKNG